MQILWGGDEKVMSRAGESKAKQQGWKHVEKGGERRRSYVQSYLRETAAIENVNPNICR